MKITQLDLPKSDTVMPQFCYSFVLELEYHFLPSICYLCLRILVNTVTLFKSLKYAVKHLRAIK